jgi:CheY-like chemotaxis protein
MEERTSRTDRRGTVLVVDGEDTVRLVLARLLEHLGYTSHFAADGQGALEVLAHRPIDCVLLSVAPPDRCGVETARELLRAAPALRLVLMSSHATPRVAAQVGDLPVVGFLQKPFSYDELCRTLSHATAATA